MKHMLEKFHQNNNFLEKSFLNLDCDGYAYYDLYLTRVDLKHTGKLQIAVNGQIPGPTLRIQRGNCVKVTVHNNLPNETTTIHFHGLFQQKTPFSDGVIGATQCGIKASSIMVYTFSTSYQPAGTYWYHSHYHEQYADGLYGALIIEDETPNSKLYSIDNDKWTWLFADWYNTITSNLVPEFLSPVSQGCEPVPDAYVVNNKFQSDNFIVYASRSQGKIRLRLLNAAAFSMVNISIDGLPLSVIEMEGFEVHPYDVSYLVLNNGQRVSVLIDFNRLDPTIQSTQALWIRYVGFSEMYDITSQGIIGATSGKTLNTTWLGRIVFNGNKNTMPNYQYPPKLNYNYTTTNIVEARPVVSESSGTTDHFIFMQIEFKNDSNGIDRGYINNATFPGSFTNITSSSNYIFKTMYDQSFRDMLSNIASSQSFYINGSSTSPFIIPFNKSIEIFINNTDSGEHPFHFHGHNFEVIATSEFAEAEILYQGNYIRRDVVSVPAFGWAKIRYRSDNPGAWLTHCHIEWHMVAGLMAILIEAPELITPETFSSIPSSQISACPDFSSLLTSNSNSNIQDRHRGLYINGIIIICIVIPFLGIVLAFGYYKYFQWYRKLDRSHISQSKHNIAQLEVSI